MGIIGIQLGFLFIGVLLLWRALDRVRLIRKLQDTPTAKIGSAPQGFVQVAGLTQALDGPGLRVPGVQVPCVWYRYQRHEEGGAGGEEEATPFSVQQTTRRFRIADRSGECVIDPNGAEVEAKKHRRWHGSDGVYHEVYWIGVGEHINVIGWMKTLHPMPVVVDDMQRADGSVTGQRYGQLSGEEHIVGKPVQNGLPFYIGASHEPYLLNRLRRERGGYLLGAFIVGAMFPLVIAFINR